MNRHFGIWARKLLCETHKKIVLEEHGGLNYRFQTYRVFIAFPTKFS
jgi:hypothetical protein